MLNDTTAPAPDGETLPGADQEIETITSSGSGETPETTTKQPSIDELQAQINRMAQALKKANNEAKTYRLESDDLKKFKEQVEAEKLSETQKQELAKQQLEKQLADLQSQHDTLARQSQERIIGYEVRLQAAQMGIVDPDAAARLLDWSEIEYDDQGTPTNVQDLLKALVKAKSYLVAKQAPTSGGATNPPRSATNVTSGAISWEMIGKLTPEQYAARRDEIQRWMSDPKNHKR